MPLREQKKNLFTAKRVPISRRVSIYSQYLNLLFSYDTPVIQQIQDVYYKFFEPANKKRAIYNAEFVRLYVPIFGEIARVIEKTLKKNIPNARVRVIPIPLIDTDNLDILIRPILEKNIPSYKRAIAPPQIKEEIPRFFARIQRRDAVSSNPYQNHPFLPLKSRIEIFLKNGQHIAILNLKWYEPRIIEIDTKCIDITPENSVVGAEAYWRRIDSMERPADLIFYIGNKKCYIRDFLIGWSLNGGTLIIVIEPEEAEEDPRINKIIRDFTRIANNIVWEKLRHDVEYFLNYLDARTFMGNLFRGIYNTFADDRLRTLWFMMKISTYRFILSQFIKRTLLELKKGGLLNKEYRISIRPKIYRSPDPSIRQRAYYGFIITIYDKKKGKKICSFEVRAQD